MKTENYGDASTWIDAELLNIRELRKHKLIDHVISGAQPTEKVASQLQEFIELKNT